MKTVKILRGIPGSGKSTLAREMGEVTVSADDYFTVDGVYSFNPRELPNAHQACWRRFYREAEAGTEVIVVDNTNITAAEIAPYVLPAEANGYKIQIITIQADPVQAFNRNVHGVPFEVVLRMAERLNSEVLPPWWEHIREDGGS